MSQRIHAIFENGILRPLDSLNLADQARVSIIVDQLNDDWLDGEVMEWAAREGDASVLLSDVRSRLSKVKGSLSDAVIADRGD